VEKPENPRNKNRRLPSRLEYRSGMGFFNNRLSVSLNYDIKKHRDLLLDARLPEANRLCKQIAKHWQGWKIKAVEFTCQ